MKRTLIGVIIYVLVTACAGWGQDAMGFFDLGLQSTITTRKIHYFTKALELNPRFSAAYEKRGMLYFYQEEYAKTVADFLRVIELKTYDSEAYRMLGLGYMRQGYLDTALIYLTSAIELDPQLARAYTNRSEAYFSKGLFEEAIQDATRAIDLADADPSIGRAYAIRSKSHRQLGHDNLAEADFEKAYRLDPENFVYRYFTITNHLASFVTDSSYIDAKHVSRVGLVVVIGLLFVLIFKLALRAPDKDQQ
ncbi:MAG: tetratricopeptide repeat protein [Deltaproteobacteria bacterium]|nr:MAG: tetratricopeptide repeat protein [Deltaproteobacteria bacterium]